MEKRRSFATSQTVVTVALLGATAVWGATFVTVKDALADADPFTFLWLRFGVGAVAAVILSGRRGRSVVAWRAAVRPGVWLGLLLFGGYALQTQGLETTSPARSAFITGLSVLFVPFISWALSGHRPSVRAFVASVLALIGLQRLTGFSLGEAIPLGDALTVGCAVLYAFHIALMSRLPDGSPPLTLAAVQLLVVCVLSFISLLVVERRLSSTPAFWAAVLFTGVVASALAVGVQVWAQRRVPAVRAAVIYSLEPVFAIGWAQVTGLGWPTPAEAVGGAVMMAAVLISELPLDAMTIRLAGRTK